MLMLEVQRICSVYGLDTLLALSNHIRIYWIDI